jgi:hypothetical protein
VNQAKAATQVSLADWCVNVNGDSATACNGGGSGGASGTSSISLASFDKTLEPGSNTLGTVTVSLGAGAGQYVSFYADYDVDFATKGSFADTGAVVGSLPAGASYELDDPNSSNIFSDFAANTLGNTNNVGTSALPPNECCDVAFALSFGNINVTSTGTVTFAITTTAPTSGFYIEQTNQYTGDSIFLQETTTLGPCTVNCNGGGGNTGTPEPSTFGLGLGLIGVALVWKRCRAA